MKRFLSGLVALLFICSFSTGVLAAKNSVGLRLDRYGVGMEYEHAFFEQLSLDLAWGYSGDFDTTKKYFENYFETGIKYYPVSEAQSGFYLAGYASLHLRGLEYAENNQNNINTLSSLYLFGLDFGYKYLFSSGLFLDLSIDNYLSLASSNVQSQNIDFSLKVPGGVRFNFGYAW